MEPQKKIRNYIIISELGSGSYGIVYKVKKENDLKEYVLKKIPLVGLDNKEIKSLENEAKFLSQLNSKYIVKYIDSFHEDKNLYIIMEYCNQGDLEYFLKEQKKKVPHLSEEIIWNIFFQIALGIAYLHSKKILHRDLKSLNIFLTDDLKIKIGDLGVAKKLGKGKFASTIIGTPYYLSPEICNNKKYNHKSDVWALGVLLYELCTFKHPFDSEGKTTLILKIINEPYEPINYDLSIELKNLIFILLEKDDIIRPGIKEILSRNEVQENAKKYGYYDDLYNFINKKTKKKNIKKKKKGLVKKKNDNILPEKKKIKISRPSSAIDRKVNNNNLIKREDKANININANIKKSEIINIPKARPSTAKKKVSSGKNVKKPIIKKENPVVKDNFNKLIEEFEKDNVKKDLKKEKVNKVIEKKVVSNKKNPNIIKKKDPKIEIKKEKKVEIKKENKVVIKKEIKSGEGYMDYKASDFFNNLNKMKPIIIKETKDVIPDEGVLDMFMDNNSDNEKEQKTNIINENNEKDSLNINKEKEDTENTDKKNIYEKSENMENNENEQKKETRITKEIEEKENTNIITENKDVCENKEEKDINEKKDIDENNEEKDINENIEKKEDIETKKSDNEEQISNINAENNCEDLNEIKENKETIDITENIKEKNNTKDENDNNENKDETTNIDEITEEKKDENKYKEETEVTETNEEKKDENKNKEETEITKINDTKEKNDNENIKNQNEKNINENIVESKNMISNLDDLLNDFSPLEEKEESKIENEGGGELTNIEGDNIQPLSTPLPIEKEDEKNEKEEEEKNISDNNSEKEEEEEEEEEGFDDDKIKLERKKTTKDEEKEEIIKNIDENKNKLKEYMGENNFNNFDELLTKVNSNKNINNDDYKVLEEFVEKSVPSDKKEEVYQFFFFLISNVIRLNNFN